MASPEEQFDDAYHAEIRGRRERHTYFTVRKAMPPEVLADDPRQYIIEVHSGSHTQVYAVTEADALAFKGILRNAFDLGQELPLSDRPRRRQA